MHIVCWLCPDPTGRHELLKNKLNKNRTQKIWPDILFSCKACATFTGKKKQYGWAT